MNLSNVSHAILALVCQGLVYLLSGDLLTGAVLASGFYLGREVAQAEAHAIADTYKTRESMPWFEGFKVWNWTPDARLDLALPVAAVFTVYFVTLGVL